MKRIFAFLMFLSPLLAFSQEAAATAEKGNFYFLFSGLVIFLALIGGYSIFEKIRDRLKEKEDHAEESRRISTQNEDGKNGSANRL